MIESKHDRQHSFAYFIRIDYRPTSAQQRIYRTSRVVLLLILSVLAHAQPSKPKPVTKQEVKSQRVDKQRLLTGYQTPITGWIVHRGDTLQLGRGSRPGKEFTYLYQHSASTNLGQRKCLPAQYSGRKAVLKEVVAKEDHGAESGLYVLLAVNSLPLYYANLDSAINGGEILLPLRYRPSAQASPAVPVIVAQGLIKLKAQLKAGQIS